jgi:hypothetical protein
MELTSSGPVKPILNVDERLLLLLVDVNAVN